MGCERQVSAKSQQTDDRGIIKRLAVIPPPELQRIGIWYSQRKGGAGRPIAPRFLLMGGGGEPPVLGCK